MPDRPRAMVVFISSCLLLMTACGGMTSVTRGDSATPAQTPLAAAQEQTCEPAEHDLRQKISSFIGYYATESSTDQEGAEQFQFVVPGTQPDPVIISYVPPSGAGHICGFTVGTLDPQGLMVPRTDAPNVHYVSFSGAEARLPTPAHFCVSRQPPLIRPDQSGSSRPVIILNCTWIFK